MKQIDMNRRSFFLDTYEGFTYESAIESKNALCAGTETNTSIEEIEKKLSSYTGFSLIKCDITKDLIPPEIEDVAIANIDVGIYEATNSSLEKVHPTMVEGGIVTVEDYGHTPYVTGSFFCSAGIPFFRIRQYYTPVYLRSGYIFLIKHP